MSRAQLLVLVLLVFSAAGCSGSTLGSGGPATEIALEYPEARRVEQIDDYHGVQVADPYRWMEEEDSEETKAWIAEQQRLLERYIYPVSGREELQRRLLEIRRFDRYGNPLRRGERYFFTKTASGATRAVLYVQKGLEGKPRRVVDFAELIDEPSRYMGGYVPSRDGKHVVFSNQAQSRWGWLDVLRVKDGRLTGEQIPGIAGNSAIWTHDNRGFYYTAYGDLEQLIDGAEPRPQLLYHRLGSDPAKDELVYSREDRPSMLFSPKLSDNGRYLVVALNDGSSTRNQVVYLDLKAPKRGFVSLISEADASYTFEGNVGTRFFFQTTLDAPRGRVVAVDLERPQREHWTGLIPERDGPIGSVSHIGGRLVVRSTIHARPVVEIWTTEGKLESTLELPGIGLVGGFSDDPEGSVAFYRLNSLYDPGTTYRVDLRSGRSVVHQRPELAFDPDDYEIRQVFYDSQDGTRVPMFLAHRKDVPLRSKRPLFMYGYGHGGWVAFPWFQPHLIAWLDMGGTYALPGLRGGGEYGTDWQAAGTLLNKPNTIADYIAAAEWLIEHDYTTPRLLVANGGSASGVVPAAAAIRRPDLFGAAVIDFPFLDMLRYHHFTTIKGWTRGYGSSDSAEEFAVLHDYSPLHNLEAGECYPAMLTLVGEEDTSTVPMHGYKFTAAFQAAQRCAGAGLVKFIPGAGHYSYGTTPDEAASTEAEMIAFLIRALGLEQRPEP